jgi:DNA/RNA-binding domain of Phe-tRNA-synthetase-like protein
MGSFQLAKEVFDKLPTYYVGVVIAEELNNQSPIEEIGRQLDAAAQSFSEEFKDINVKEDPRIVPYRDAFRKLQINPNKFMCSIESLAKRAQKKGALPHINPAVDLGNAVSLENCIPIGAHNIDAFENAEMEVRFALEDDAFQPMGTEDHEKPDAGELVYVSGHTVKTRRWTWRQSEDGKITEETRNILYPLDGFTDINLPKVMQAQQELQKRLEALFRCKTYSGFIDKDHRSFSW